MKHKLFSKWSLGLVGFTAAFSLSLLQLSGCGSDSPAGPGGVLPVLAAADKDSVAPCPSQTLLTDATFLADFKAATAFTLLYDDTAGLTSICAMDANFTGPGTKTAAATVTNFNLNGLINMGIWVCGTNNAVQSLPKAGTYRKDFKFTANGSTYQVRLRTTITAGTPDVTGSTLTSNGIADLEADLTYTDSKGTALTPDATLQTTASTSLIPTGEFIVKKGANVMFNAKVEMICAAKL